MLKISKNFSERKMAQDEQKALVQIEIVGSIKEDGQIAERSNKM